MQQGQRESTERLRIQGSVLITEWKDAMDRTGRKGGSGNKRGKKWSN